MVVYDDQFAAKNSPDAYRCVIKGKDLYPFSASYGEDYFVTVTARDSFGRKSTPLRSRVYRGSGGSENRDITETPHREWQFKLFTSFNKFPKGYEYVGPNLGMKEPPRGVDYNSTPSPEMSGAARHPALGNHGFGGSMALGTKIRSQNSYTDYIFMRPSMGFRGDFMGAEEFWMWVDCSDVQFESCYAGFRVNDDYGPAYLTTNHENDPKMVYYTLRDGEKAWKKNSFSRKGTMNLSGFRGFVRFDLDYICQNVPIRPEKLKALIFGFTPKDSRQIGKEFYIDQIGFAGPQLPAADGTVKMLLDEQEQFDSRRPIPAPETPSEPFRPFEPADPSENPGGQDSGHREDIPLPDSPGSLEQEESDIREDTVLSDSSDPDRADTAVSAGTESGTGEMESSDRSSGRTEGSGWIGGTVIGVSAALIAAAAAAVILFRRKKAAEQPGEPDEKAE